MQYVGGKQKSGGHRIAALVRLVCDLQQTDNVREPFCGGLSVTYRLQGLTRTASDACKPLIGLYRAVQQGWDPPEVVSQETWEHYRASPDPTDPMTAFCGIGCSRSGAWFSGFIEDYKYTDRRVPAAEAARRSLLRKMGKCQDVDFWYCDYLDIGTPLGCVVYCDPPYRGSIGYPGSWFGFDSDEFWEWAREISEAVPVLVSEQQAPDDFESLVSWSVQSRISTPAGGRRVEHVFAHRRWGWLRDHCTLLGAT